MNGIAGSFRPWMRIAASMAGLAVAVWAVVSWLDSAEIRYQKFPFLYEYIYAYEGTIDLAVVGPSREATMLDAGLLSELLMARRGKRLVIVDFGREFPGIDLEYIVIRDLLTHRKVSNLLLELSIPYADPTHVWTHRVGTVGDIVEGYLVRRDISLLRRLQRAGQDISRKIAGDFSLLIQGEIVNLDPERIKPVTTLDISGPGVTRPEKLLKLYEERRRTGPLATEMPVTSPHLPQYMHFLEKIVGLARKHGVNLILVESERYASEPLDPALVDEIQSRFEVPVLQMHASGVAGMPISHYVDSQHVNYRGQKAWTHWLADVLPALR